jgi:O-antigen/teichoic acid export membrane protein
MFVNGVNNMFQPLTIREMHEKGLPAMLSTLFESILVVVSVLTVFSIAILFFSGEVLTIYGKQYPTYRLLCFLMSISVCCVSISTLLGNGLAALGVSKGYFWGEIACFTAAVVSACILLPLLGVNGAAIATTLGGVAATVVTAITLRFRIMGATSANILRE